MVSKKKILITKIIIIILIIIITVPVPGDLRRNPPWLFSVITIDIM